MNKAKKDILIGLLILVLEITFFYYFWQNNLLLVFLLAAISAFLLVKWSNKAERILYLVCFVLGPLFDLTLVPRGAWSYSNPTIFGVPAWLPFAYGLGTVMIVKIGNSLAKMV